MSRVVLFSFFVALLCNARLAVAETASVFVPAGADPQQAVALVQSPNSFTQRQALKMTPFGDGSVIVDFDYSIQDVRDGAFATVMVLNGDGSASFSNTIMLEPNKKGISSDYRAKLPTCSSQRIGEIRHNQQGLFESLIEIRTERLQNTRAGLEKIGTEDLFKKLRKLERGFGFSYTTPLSLALPPVELAQRLDQLKHAVQGYELYKKRRSVAAEKGKK